MLILIRMDIIKDCHGIFMGIIGLSAMVWITNGNIMGLNRNWR